MTDTPTGTCGALNELYLAFMFHLNLARGFIVRCLPHWVVTHAVIHAIDHATNAEQYPRSDPGDIRAITVLKRWVELGEQHDK